MKKDLKKTGLYGLLTYHWIGNTITTLTLAGLSAKKSPMSIW